MNLFGLHGLNLINHISDCAELFISISRSKSILLVLSSSKITFYLMSVMFCNQILQTIYTHATVHTYISRTMCSVYLLTWYLARSPSKGLVCVDCVISMYYTTLMCNFSPSLSVWSHTLHSINRHSTTVHPELSILNVHIFEPFSWAASRSLSMFGFPVKQILG